MPCPHLKEVVMLYCDAFPVKKMVPIDKLVSADPCLTYNFHGCPLFQQRSAPPPENAALPVRPLDGEEVRR